MERGSTLTVASQGQGGVDEMKEDLLDGAVLFGYVRVELGSDRRQKFALVKWVGEGVRAMQRARAFEESRIASSKIKVNAPFCFGISIFITVQIQSIITKNVKVFHVEVAASKGSDLTHRSVSDRLKAAAGANYDKDQNAVTGSNSSLSSSSNAGPKHEFGAYKNASKAFFQSVEKQGTIGAVLYDTKPLSERTPVDLGVRAMTVGATEAKANTVDLRVSRGQEQQK